MQDICKKLRLIELFAGYGSQAMALKRMGVDFEHYKVVEFDKYAIKSYNAVHGTNFKPVDIKDVTGEDLKINESNKYIYLMTYSFPCTDLSVAGKQAGMSKGNRTQSGLLWEVERLLNECEELPQILFMENVPQVHGKKNINDFNNWLNFLKGKGYTNYWQDLNAKDYGIPQSRNRCYMFSFLNNESYEFPKPIKLTKRVVDILEKDVEEKYYLKGEKPNALIEKLIKTGNVCNNALCDLSLNDPEIKNEFNCILARTDRGISNLKSMGKGVIEWK